MHKFNWVYKRPYNHDRDNHPVESDIIRRNYMSELEINMWVFRPIHLLRDTEEVKQTVEAMSPGFQHQHRANLQTICFQAQILFF